MIIIKKFFITTLLLVSIAIPLYAVALVPDDIWDEYVYWTEMVRKYPSGSISHFNLAMTMAYMGKVQEGAAFIKKADELDENAVQKLLRLYETKQFHEPHNWRWNFRLGFLYYFDGKISKALTFFEKVAHKKPVRAENAWAYGYIAVIKGEQAKWHRAAEACQAGLAIEPDGAALHAALAKAYAEQKKPVEAAAEMVIALKLLKDFEAYEKDRCNKQK